MRQLFLHILLKLELAFLYGQTIHIMERSRTGSAFSTVILRP